MSASISEDYLKRCGDIFLTTNGNLVMHCICDEKFYEFQDYTNHVHEQHYLVECETEFLPDFQSDDGDMPTKSIEANEHFASLVSEDDLKMLDELEFFAPEPENCREIEEYVISLRSEKKNVKFKRNPQHLQKPRQNSFKPPKQYLRKQKTVMYKCPHCDFISHANSSINQHVRRHTGIKKEKCTLCPKSFYVPSELRVHMRFHNKERPYLCTDCGRAFHTCSALTSHLKSCRDIRDKECVRCGKKFHSVTALRNHMTSHSDERSFHCEICGAKFKLSKALKSHLKIHENKQEYKCQLCPASFNQAPGLFAHLKSHSRANSINISILKNS